MLLLGISNFKAEIWINLMPKSRIVWIPLQRWIRCRWQIFVFEVLLSSLLQWCVYSKNTSKLVNRQAQSGSEPVSGPRAKETVAFYTVRTKNREGQVQPKGKQKTCKGRVSWGHTCNKVIKVGPEVLGQTGVKQICICRVQIQLILINLDFYCWIRQPHQQRKT